MYASELRDGGSINIRQDRWDENADRLWTTGGGAARSGGASSVEDKPLERATDAHSSPHVHPKVTSRDIKYRGPKPSEVNLKYFRQRGAKV